MTAFDLSVRFFLQLAFILCVCRAMGMLFKIFGQSQVVSEMIAGVAIGPSLMGWAFPSVNAYLFPTDSKPILFSIAQLGLVLYMFLVGTEFDLDLLKTRIRSAFTISMAGVLTPAILGASIAYFIWDDPTLFSTNTTLAQVTLFMAAAMSITAFPMLARIIVEQGLSRTSLGTLALAAGAFDDAVAWCMLAIVLAFLKSDLQIAMLAIGGGLGFGIFCLCVLKSMLRPFGRKIEAEAQLSSGNLILVLGFVMLGAWFTDFIQIYAVFGAFLVGVSMPRGTLTEELQKQLHPLTTTLLLPVFFIYSGLNTRIDLVDSPRLWLIAFIVLVFAVFGKGVACYAAARFSGEDHRTAAGIGILMNARGLMELIILNIGLQAGIIGPAMFSIMIIMAIVTTLMATPLFERIYGRKNQRPASVAV